jgi:hypothetical protein
MPKRPNKTTKHLLIAVLNQAMIDYQQEVYREDVLKWVKSSTSTIRLVAEALDRDHKALREMVIDKLKRMDEGEPLKIN